MIGFLASALGNRPWRAGTLALGILAAAVAFVLLTGSAATSALRVQGTLKSNYRNTYDILIRPKGSFTRLERQQGLVRPNYLSGIFGGISLRQYEEIQRIPGVEVAAPIAMIGYILQGLSLPIDITAAVRGRQAQVFLLTDRRVSDRGLTRFPPRPIGYVYLTPDRFALPGPLKGPIHVHPGLTSGPTEILPDGSRRTVCRQYAIQPGLKSPFADYQAEDGACLTLGGSNASVPGLPPHHVGGRLEIMFPILLAAVDPAAEQALVGLKRTLVRGRYLKESDRPTRTTGPISRVVVHPQVPVIATTDPFVDDRDVVTVSCLPAAATGLVRKVLSPKALARALAHEPRTTALHITVTARQAYRQFLQRLRAGLSSENDAYWTASPTRYKEVRAGRLLAPLITPNPVSVWKSKFYGTTGFEAAPLDNADRSFRRLHEVLGNNKLRPNVPVSEQDQFPVLKAVGEFDPTKLPGFSPLSRVPLETYYPPTAGPADQAAAKALGGKTLLPDANMAGYLQMPPLILTTLKSLPAFERGFPGSHKRAPISAIRIRVADVRGTDAFSQLRIRTVAQQIHNETGLDVDITAGSSPHPLDISLPAGKFGRPKLLLSEGWSKKGATISYLKALDRKDLALFALVLVVCCFFLANGALAAVRARRTEIGTLRTLGWPDRAIFSAILGELLVVAAAAGIAGTGIAALLVWQFTLHVPLSHVFYVLPLAIVLALLAGIGPAWEATRGEPLDAVRPPVAAGRRGHAHGLLRLALLNLRRLPLRTAIGAGGLALGVAALTVLIGIERAFHGTLVGTLLGNAVSIQVRRPDLVAAGITIALAALAIGDVLYLNLRERSPELATLRATGWRDSHVVRLILLEGIGLGLLGSAVGLGVGLLVGTELLPVPLQPVLTGGGIAAGAGIIAALIAATLPTAQALRIEPSVVLAGE